MYVRNCHSLKVRLLCSWKTQKDTLKCLYTDNDTGNEYSDFERTRGTKAKVRLTFLAMYE